MIGRPQFSTRETLSSDMYVWWQNICLNTFFLRPLPYHLALRLTRPVGIQSSSSHVWIADETEECELET